MSVLSKKYRIQSNAGWILQKSKLTQAKQMNKDSKCDKTIPFFCSLSETTTVSYQCRKLAKQCERKNQIIKCVM